MEAVASKVEASASKARREMKEGSSTKNRQSPEKVRLPDIQKDSAAKTLQVRKLDEGNQKAIADLYEKLIRLGNKVKVIETSVQQLELNQSLR